LRSLRLPRLAGRSVLDVGAYDAFYSFAAERLGANRVVALDHYVWSLDLPEHIEYWRTCKRLGVVPEPYHATPHWRPAELPGKRGYDTAHRLLGNRVETVVADFMAADLRGLGVFDVVFFLGVLYHLENPLGALRRLFEVTRELAVIETAAIRIAGYDPVPLWEFYESNELNADVSNWWAPNEVALLASCRAAGFRHAVALTQPPQWGLSTWIKSLPKFALAAGSSPRRLGLHAIRSRAVVHAWR
jgi:tRNA (mo5U34)-methyltransferase